MFGHFVEANVGFEVPNPAAARSLEAAFDTTRKQTQLSVHRFVEEGTERMSSII